MGTANNAGALIRTMLALRAQRKTGVLDVVADEVTTRIFLLKGMPIFAEEDTPGEPLGRLLLRQKIITQEQHVQVIDCMTRSLADSEQVRYGEVAVELGFLDQDDLHRGLLDQVRWRIVRTLQRESIEWRFEASDDGLANVRQLLLQIESLVLDAARWFTDDRRAELALNDVKDRFPLLIGDPTLVAERFEMNGPETRFLLRVDGSKTVAELLAEPPPADVDVAAVLTAIVLTAAAGMVDERHEPGEPRESLPSPPRMRIAGARPSSPPTSATTARLRAMRAVARLKQARAEHVRHPEQRADARTPSTEHEARILAEHSFQRGKAYLRANHLGLALPELRRAFELQPESLEYQLYATWVASRSRDRPTSEQERSALGRLAKSASQHDPSSAFAQYVLGHVALLEGADAVARERFNMALRLDPHAIDAERHIRLLALRHRNVRKGAPQPPASRPKVEPTIDLEATAKPGDVTITEAVLDLEKTELDKTERPAAVAIPRPRETRPWAGMGDVPPAAGSDDATAIRAQAELDKIDFDELEPEGPDLDKTDRVGEVAPVPAVVGAELAKSEPKVVVAGSKDEAAKPDALSEAKVSAPRIVARVSPSRVPAKRPATDSGSQEVADEELELLEEAPLRRSIPPPLPKTARTQRRTPATANAAPLHGDQAPQGSFWTGVALVAAAAGIALIVHGWRSTPTLPSNVASADRIVGAASPASASPTMASTAARPTSESPPGDEPRVAAATSSAPVKPSASIATIAAPPSASIATPPVTPSASTAAVRVDAGASGVSSAAITATAPATRDPATALTAGPGGGILLLPRSAEQHRIYVDGKLAGNGSAPIRVACGHRVVQIGSAGKERELDVPCGGEISVGP